MAAEGVSAELHGDFTLVTAHEEASAFEEHDAELERLFGFLAVGGLGEGDERIGGLVLHGGQQHAGAQPGGFCGAAPLNGVHEKAVGGLPDGEAGAFRR